MPLTGARAHPRGLYVLFLTEMWERFSYYGMRALLVLYLVEALAYAREDALHLYATYTALVYLTPIVGGYIADRWLGKRRAVLSGAVVMAMGHFAMAFPDLLHLALGLLVAGNGFFKPNISTMVGALYADGDARRDSGFTVFYMGINLGAFVAPLICGTLGEKFGWHYGFGAAGIGMLLGLWVFAWGQRLLGEAGRPPVASNAGPMQSDWSTVIFVSALTLAAVAAVEWGWPRMAPWWDQLPPWGQLALGLSLVAAAVIAVRAKPRRDVEQRALTRQDLHRILAMAIIGVFVVFFWMGFEQAGGTMNLFALKRTDRVIGGWEMPASYFQALNPLLILLLAPVFSMMWTRLDRSRLALSSVSKQALGMIILGLGFVVLAVADGHAERVGPVSPLWLAAAYFLMTSGELCLSPIGLSMVTKLAPVHLVSLMMGLWFTAIAAANYLAGTLEAMLHGSGWDLYWFLVASSVGAGVTLLLLTPLIRRLMG